MNRRIFLSTTLGLTALIATLSGCGGSSDNNRNDAGNPAGRGAAEGYVFRSEGGDVVFFNTAAEGAAEGLQPADGLRAEVVGGPSVTVGGDGRLRLTGIEPGLRTLRLTPAGGTSTSTSMPLTVVPGAVLPLGQTAISRQTAVEALRAAAAGLGAPDILIGADVLVTSTPLPAGVRVRPALPSAGDEEAEEIVVERPSWMVYLDRAPQARFGHATVVALVDAETGAVGARDALSWPLINDASFYAYGQVNATSPDAVRVATRRAATRTGNSGGSRSSSTETTFLGDATAEVASSAAATCRAADPETSRTHVLLIQGDRRQDFAEDMEDVAVSLGVDPFPQTDTFRRIRTFEGSTGARARILQEFAAVRDAAKSGDTFVLYVTSHGMIEEDYSTSYPSGRGSSLVFKPVPPRPPTTPEEIAATYRLVCETGSATSDNIAQSDGRSYRADVLRLTEFDFSPCKACRIILWIDTCYSGNWISILSPQLVALKDRDILILTSANQQRISEGIDTGDETTIEVDGGLLALPVGGLFTNGLVEGLRRVRGSDAAETGADALAAAFDFASAVTAEKNLKTGAEEYQQQYPQIFRRPLDPDAVCGKGNEIINVT